MTSSTPALPSVATKEGREKRRPKGRFHGSAAEMIAAYLFLAPYLIVLGVFTVFVALYGIGLSLFKLDIGFTAAEFVGFRNYQNLFSQLSYATDSDFWMSMINILKFALVVVIGETVLALFLAILLQSISTSRGVFRTIFYIPSVTSSVAVALIFLWFYNPQGLINYLLSLVHIPGPHWLEDPAFALPAIMILNIWTTSATFMLFFLAALQDLPRELYEAAEVDGANHYHLFWNITVPLLRPSIFFVVAVGTIGAFQMFDQAFFMTNGGPLNSTLTPLLEIYNTAFKYNHFGLAAAMSVILFILIFIVTLIQRRLIDVNG